MSGARASVLLRAAIISAGLGVIASMAASGGLRRNFAISLGGLESSADSVCAPLWIANARNDPALDCYLTHNVERLCSVPEKLHMASVLRRYRFQTLRFEFNVLFAVLWPRLMPVATTEDLAQARAEVAAAIDGKAGPREPKALRKIAEARLRAIVESRPEGLDAALDVEELPQARHVASIRAIASRGLMKRHEFGWFPGDFVSAAFADIRADDKSCPGYAP